MGKHGWLIEQLVDLAEYAALNGLPKISGAISDASNIAITDLYSQNESQHCDTGSTNTKLDLTSIFSAS